jgi:S1-C subfamily serine protease
MEPCRWHGKVVFIFCLFLGLVLVLSPSKAEKIYKWVDERGVVHFSDRLPDLPDTLKLKVEERDLSNRNSEQKVSESEVKLLARSPIEFVTNCTFTIRGDKKMGTGFLISSTGYGVTCRHVVEGSGELSAIMSDQQEHQLNIITLSRTYDLAIVQVMTPRKRGFLSIREADNLVPGERLFAVGASAGLQATVTDGVFTAFRKLDGAEVEFLQFSAPVNPGNSGGPLVDESGKVVGVVSQKFLAQRGIPITGVGFAVPSRHLREEFANYLE